MDLQLAGRVAIVTGGSGGLGSAICRGLAAEGAAVCVHYHRRQAEAQRLAAELAAAGGSAVAVAGDIGVEADVRRLFDAAESALGPAELLVNNAARCPTAPVEQFDLAEWEATLNTNLTGAFLASRELVRRLLAQQRRGRIVNIASQAAFRGSTTGHAPYDASKGGLVSLTVSMARELGPKGIAVNAIAAGMMRTEMTARALAANEAKYLARIPLGRIGEASEVAAIAVLLCSDRAGYMTGATVDVSGGMLMR